MKRLLDLLLSLACIMLFSPLFILVGLLIRIIFGKPIWFKQLRPGLYGIPFTMYKFRTMIDAKDQYGNYLPDNDRIKPFGKLLRSTSLDELPELFNVLKGDMSLVGPRPLLMEYLPCYTSQQARRHEVKPGITGWAQINGRNAISWEDKFKLDVWYVDNRSFWLDCKIIWLTLLKVFKQEGITQAGHATMEKFMGSRKTHD